MDPGAYVEPLVRTTWVQVPMVSGYVGSRIRVADALFGTNFTQYGTNTGAFTIDNGVRLLIENIAPSSGGTNIYFQVQETYGTQTQFTRSPLTAEYGLVPNGRTVVNFTFGAPILEIKCTGGGGNIRAQIDSQIKWEEMAYDRYDAFFAPTLWNAKHPVIGVPAPSPFPTS